MTNITTGKAKVELFELNELMDEKDIQPFNRKGIKSSDNTHQIMTVVHDRSEDDNKCRITIIKEGQVKQFIGDNKYNTSNRRQSSSVYVVAEDSMYRADGTDAEH